VADVSQPHSYCGIAGGEEAYCFEHAAEYVGLAVHQVRYHAERTRRLEAFPPDERPPGGVLRCGRRARLNCLIPLGQLLILEDEVAS
jgi:hypothetical protein